jgi:hypothetical protein
MTKNFSLTDMTAVGRSADAAIPVDPVEQHLSDLAESDQ